MRRPRKSLIVTEMENLEKWRGKVEEILLAVVLDSQPDPQDCKLEMLMKYY